MTVPGALLAQAEAEKAAACGPTGRQSWLCSTVYEITGSRDAAELADTLASPIRIAFVILLALIANWLLRRLIKRVARRVIVAPQIGPLSGVRRMERIETMSHVVGSITTVVIFVITVFVVLGELGVDVGPLLAGAGVLGVALGFGAQSIVRDFLSGLFMVSEDQFGVGDVIDVGGVTGTVEGFTLRVTRLRDVAGNVWHVPNGSIPRVGNQSQQWARAVLDIAVAYDTDIPKALELMKTVADSMWHHDEWSDVILAEPEVWGVEAFVPEGPVIRTVVKTKPHEQWNVAREMRARVLEVFDEAGIQIRR
ncbi:MAG: mechanosensitive ion channel family protein [Actinobacteria bacterium]|nr:mechanosensitive ion channel family protein [Actinomycetota bacterium]